MQAPVSMLGGVGGSKAALVVAVLVGIFVVAAMKQNTGQPGNSPTR